MTALRNPRTLGRVALLLSTAALALIVTGAYRHIGGDDRRVVRAEFVNTAALRTGAAVRVGGVNVGEVTRIHTAAGSRAGVVEMRISDADLQLYRDAQAAISWRTLLGGSYAVSLRRGTPPAGDLGAGVIPRSQTTSQVELDDALEFDRGAGRAGLQRLPSALAAAVADPAQPAAVLDTLDDVAPSVRGGVGAVRGERPDELERLVTATARTAAALDAPDNDLEKLVAGAATAFEVGAGRRADIERALQLAPETMRRGTATLKRLRASLELADPLLTDLQPGAAALEPTLRTVRPALVGADRLLTAARPLLAELRPALGATRTFAPNGRAVLEGLRPGLRRVDQRVLPALGERSSETDRTAAEMIGPAFAAVGNGLMSQVDGNGHLLRFPSGPGPNSLQTAPCQLVVTNPDAQQLATCQSLTEALEQLFNFDPLGPTPGSAPSRKAHDQR